jgi:hypothetical protein
MKSIFFTVLALFISAQLAAWANRDYKTIVKDKRGFNGKEWSLIKTTATPTPSPTHTPTSIPTSTVPRIGA